MKKLSRKAFLERTGLAAMSAFFIDFPARSGTANSLLSRNSIQEHKIGEDIFAFIQRTRGKWDQKLYQQIIGSANPFKEGDATLGVAAQDDKARGNARYMLSQSSVKDLHEHSLFTDELKTLIDDSVDAEVYATIQDWSMEALKDFILNSPEEEIHEIIPGLPSDVIACVVKLMSNDELIKVGQKVFNPLPGSKIGSKGYMSARIQPNSPTDNIDDITWQVFCAWSYGVGDLVLGTNPVSSETESVASVEKALNDILVTFNLQDTMPNCVLSHIDVQARAEDRYPGTTGIWFQSLAGTVEANKTFDVTIDKMFRHARARKGRYGLYAETGQGADFTNGHGEGFDMVVHESRKYGFLRALKSELRPDPATGLDPWVHVNDVAGFIGPEVFRSREQLVRTCLEDTVMGKLHGLTIGLDICSTLHMDVTLDDLDWCIDQVMPANPAYLMALPTKNDPMLSYLTTAFNNHLKIREKYGYRVNDDMWQFFKDIQVIDSNGNPTDHFGDPIWVYYQFRKRKGDTRSESAIYSEGRKKIEEIQQRGVPIAEGYGASYSDLPEDLEAEVNRLYEDAKVSIWSELNSEFISSLGGIVQLTTNSEDRIDYVYHPESGESLTERSRSRLLDRRMNWQDAPDVQIVISDGLNARALMDEGHLQPFIAGLLGELRGYGLQVADEHVLIINGRVRAGYECGELLFGDAVGGSEPHGVIHIIGERPGSGHHNFSAYLTSAPAKIWAQKGRVDHDITRVVSGISDSALSPEQAARETAQIFKSLYGMDI